ncbi:MAG: hypothetical protein E3K37_12130 [Candidatus Kuenenia sp.]|nr:hypothetical protein [Candidatus Kuenenia hertensis]
MGQNHAIPENIPYLSGNGKGRRKILENRLNERQGSCQGTVMAELLPF